MMRVPMVAGRPLDTPACPQRHRDLAHVHQVHELGSFGLELGYGYECQTCWTKFTVKPDGELVLGHPEPAPYPAWDFEEDP